MNKLETLAINATSCLEEALVGLIHEEAMKELIVEFYKVSPKMSAFNWRPGKCDNRYFKGHKDLEGIQVPIFILQSPTEGIFGFNMTVYDHIDFNSFQDGDNSIKPAIGFFAEYENARLGDYYDDYSLDMLNRSHRERVLTERTEGLKKLEKGMDLTLHTIHKLGNKFHNLKRAKFNFNPILNNLRRISKNKDETRVATKMIRSAKDRYGFQIENGFII